MNPWNAEALSTALQTALTMSPEERRAKHDLMYKYPVYILELFPYAKYLAGSNLEKEAVVTVALERARYSLF